MPGGFFFDRNIPLRAVQALQVLRTDVTAHDDLFPPTEPDEAIVREVARRGEALVTRDAKMANRPRQRRVLLDAGLHVFVNADGGNLPTWEFFVLLVRHFGAMEKIIATEAPAIFFYSRTSGPRLRYVLDAGGAMVSRPRSGG